MGFLVFSKPYFLGGGGNSGIGAGWGNAGGGGGGLGFELKPYWKL